MKSKGLFFLLGLSICLASCKKDEEVDPVVGGINYSKGIWIINEGSFGNQNASISYISETAQVVPDAFMAANNVSIGDVLQDVEVHNGKAYAVLNNSLKLVVFNTEDFKIVDEVVGFDYPRHIVFADNKAFVSDGAFAGSVKVIDLSTNEIIQSIPVGNGPEQMALSNGFLYVCNSGGWTTDNTVSVIDLSTESVVSTIVVGDRPLDIEVDITGNAWVLSSGETLYDENWNVMGHTAAYLNKISSTHVLTDQYVVGEEGDHPRSFSLSSDATEVLVVNGPLWSASLSDVSGTWQVLVEGSFNSVDTDEVDETYWLTSVPDFVTNSEVHKVNDAGQITHTYEAGIGAHSVHVYH
jgi:YVTN family beta-propeller protein